ncbi:hypothetical protein Cgig2_009442 [Carnegiea gigantea]|uniref:Uncharacterized protein n=1 Tax=Carnegiea gigantea TaxID=171969 RepID=A0A9Q1QD06_9CARY|nr:hypothetical protein Cgig2_009442 [Carnegiea gigantea]
MEKHHRVEATNMAPHLKEDQRGSLLNSSTVRGDFQLHDSVSIIVKEIIIEHIVSILEDGCLGTSLIYSIKVNVMKVNVVVTHSIDKVVSHKSRNNGDSVVQGVDGLRQPRFGSSELVVSQQPEMEIFSDNAKGRLASSHRIIGKREESDKGVTFLNSGDNSHGITSCNFLETREDALAFNATSSPIPNHIYKEPCILLSPLLPGLVLEIGPNIGPPA